MDFDSLSAHAPDVVVLQLRESATFGLELHEEDPAVADEDPVGHTADGRGGKFKRNAAIAQPCLDAGGFEG
jgi:hypothetical protein